MTFSLYDAVVPSSRQILSAIDAVLDKAQAFCTEQGRSEQELIDARLAPDMLPFGYQVKSCMVHSIGAVEGAIAGSFSPDRSAWPSDFAGFHELIRNAMTRLDGVDRTTIDALVDRDVRFVAGDTSLPFTGADFLLSFSQPNFYFHATTGYAILRAQGVPLGKRDFIGTPRLKR